MNRFALDLLGKIWQRKLFLAMGKETTDWMAGDVKAKEFYWH